MKRFARAIAAVVAATALLLAATAAPASATTTWTDVWIQQLSGPLCAAVTSTTSTPVIQATCVDVATQLWNVGPVFVGSSADTIANLGSGECMAASGTSVIQATCTALNDQRWVLSGSGNTFQIRNVQTSTCLSAHGVTVNVQMILVACSQNLGGPRWQLLF